MMGYYLNSIEASSLLCEQPTWQTGLVEMKKENLQANVNVCCQQNTHFCRPVHNPIKIKRYPKQQVSCHRNHCISNLEKRKHPRSGFQFVFCVWIWLAHVFHLAYMVFKIIFWFGCQLFKNWEISKRNPDWIFFLETRKFQQFWSFIYLWQLCSANALLLAALCSPSVACLLWCLDPVAVWVRH